MFLDSWLGYLNLHNASRITGLSIYDPFAMFGFILLLLTVTIALILLCVTTRRSVESIFDEYYHDSRMRRLQRTTRRATTVGDVLREQERQSMIAERASTGVPHRASFLMPTSRSPPPPGRITLSERMPWWPSRRTKKLKSSRYAIIGQSRAQSSWPLVPTFTRSSSQEPVLVPSRRPSLQITPPVYEASRQPAPELHVSLSREATLRGWSIEFRQDLERTGRDMV